MFPSGGKAKLSGIAQLVNGTLVVYGGKEPESAVGAAVGDGSEQQFGAKSAASEVSLDGGSRFLRGGTGIEENNDRWAGAAAGLTEPLRLT